MSRRVPSKAEADAALAEALKQERWPADLLRALPEDVDPSLAAKAARVLVDRKAWAFGRACQRLPAPVIRELLRALEGDSGVVSVFTRASVDPDQQPDASLRESWAAALVALLDLDTTYAWGSKQRRAKIAALARSPRFLAAAQAVAVGCAKPPLDALAVLAADGSDASIDALMPQFVKAADEKGWALDLLGRLKTHANDTPAMKRMLAQVEELIGERNATSPALDWARSVGLGEQKRVWFQAFLGSHALNEHEVPRYQCNLAVDSRRQEWFSVHVSSVSSTPRGERRTSFNLSAVHADTLGLGTCKPEGLGDWLARAEVTLKTRWDYAGMYLSTSLRGRKREALVGWLAGGEPG